MGNLSEVARFFSLQVEVEQDIADLIVSIIQAELTLFDTTADIFEKLGVYFYAVDHRLYLIKNLSKNRLRGVVAKRLARVRLTYADRLDEARRKGELHQRERLWVKPHEEGATVG